MVQPILRRKSNLSGGVYMSMTFLDKRCRHQEIYFDCRRKFICRQLYLIICVGVEYAKLSNESQKNLILNGMTFYIFRPVFELSPHLFQLAQSKQIALVSFMFSSHNQSCGKRNGNIYNCTQLVLYICIRTIETKR